MTYSFFKFIQIFIKMHLRSVVVVCVLFLVHVSQAFKIEGRVLLPGDSSLVDTRIIVDDGVYKAFLKVDGSFVVHNVPSGSYVLEVVSPVYLFEPARVDVSSKGNVRARKLNNLKPSSVSLLKYPLEMKALALTKYFQQREKFSLLDMLKSPMVLMMLLPLVMLVIVPKLMNASDPETRKEMEESMQMFNQNSSQMPDMSEMFTKWFGGSQKKSTKAVTSGKTGKSQKRRKND